MPTTTANPRPGLTLSDAEGQKIVNLLNAGRRNVTPTAADMQKAEWDPELAADLKAFAAKVGPGWFFISNNYTGKNGFNLMERPEFKNKYPDYYYMLHDTTQSKLSHGISGIFKFRINQKPCFNYNNCSTTRFNGYSSCYSNPMPRRNCNWVMQYYPYLMQSNMSKIACVPLDIHGPNAPAKQDMSFFCYGRFKNTNNGLENTDLPYLSGPPCSKCPPEAPVSDNGLCRP